MYENATDPIFILPMGMTLCLLQESPLCQEK